MDSLPLSTAPPLALMDVIGPAIGAVIFVLVMQGVPEPTRRRLNAVLAGGAAGVYLSGGFGVWELAFPLLVTPVVYRGLTSPGFIGIAWLMHAAWDLPHHLWGNPIWPFMPTSSFGCVVFDTLIALWFLAGAPTLIHSRASDGVGRASGPPRSPAGRSSSASAVGQGPGRFPRWWPPGVPNARASSALAASIVHHPNARTSSWRCEDEAAHR